MHAANYEAVFFMSCLAVRASTYQSVLVAIVLLCQLYAHNETAACVLAVAGYMCRTVSVVRPSC